MLLLERVEEAVEVAVALEPGGSAISTISARPAVTEPKVKMNLLEAEPGHTYTIAQIRTEDDEMNAFLFRLGAYSGEPITLVSKKKRSAIVVIKAGRYSLDAQLARSIIV